MPVHRTSACPPPAGRHSRVNRPARVEIRAAAKLSTCGAKLLRRTTDAVQEDHASCVHLRQCPAKQMNMQLRSAEHLSPKRGNQAAAISTSSASEIVSPSAFAFS